MKLLATINVILSVWVTGTSLLVLLPHTFKLYSQLKLHPSLMRMINRTSRTILHSRNKLNLIVWDIYRKGNLTIDEKRRLEIRKQLEKKYGIHSR